MAFGLFYGGEDGEYDGVGFVDISKIFAKQDTFSLGNGPISFDRVERCGMHSFSWDLPEV